MSRPSEPSSSSSTPIDIGTKPSVVSRSNSKRTLRKKGSSSNLGDSPTTGGSADSPVASPSSSTPDSTDSRSFDVTSGAKPPAANSGSPSGISLAIQTGRRQKISGKSKAGTTSEEEDAKDTSKALDSPSPRLKDWGISPRSSPHYQAALAADPSLTYIPTRVYLVTDVNFISYQSNALQGSSSGSISKPLDFVALSVGRLWNLNTFLLIAGEKLNLSAQAIFLKTRLARVISIHDLREDDELILCSHIEGPFALLDRKEQAHFVRLSPRQRLNSAPVEAFNIQTPPATATGPKSESAPKSRPPSSSISVADSPSKTALIKSPSPPHRDSSDPKIASSSSDSIAGGRKKTRPALFAEDAASNGSQSPTPKSTRKNTNKPSSSSTTTTTTTTPGSPTPAMMSSSTDSLDRISPTPSKTRNGIGARSKKMSKQSSSGSANKVPRLRIEEETKDDLNAIYSSPITSQLPFEGRRLVRRDTTSFLDTMLNEEIKLNAVAAIKEHDKSIGVSIDHPVVIRHGDTGKERTSFSVEILYLELKRSRSLPDVWMNGTYRQISPSSSFASYHSGYSSSTSSSWGPISTSLALGGSSTTSTTSTFRDEDGEFSDDDSSSLTSSSNVDLDGKDGVVTGDDRDLNPLTMSEEDVLKRMAHEEKQDVANLQVKDNEVQAGTLRALIRRLFWEYSNDDFVQHFLLTYDLFISHVSLLKTLIMLFRVPMSESHVPATPRQAPGTPTMSSRRNLKVTALRKQGSDPDSLPSSPRGGASRESPSKDPSSTRSSSADLSESDGKESDSIGAISSGMSSSSANLGEKATGMKMVIQHRILTTIKQWMELRYDILSLKANRNFFVLFNEFCEYLSSAAIDKQKYSSILLGAVKTAKYNRLLMKQQVELSKPPSSKASTMASSTIKAPTKITDILPKDWAVYFTLREQSFYGRVRLKEYHMTNMGSKDMAKKSPHLTKLINHFNKLSMWVATAIFRCEGFSESTPRNRAIVVTHFLKIMEELRILQNYSSMMAIYSALSMTPIDRLDKTWPHVPSEDKAYLKEATRLRDANCKAYREKLEVSEPPYIPIQEVLIKDLTLIEENPTILDNGWINFSKIFMLGKAYKAIKRSQTTPYQNKYPAGVYTFHKLHGNMTLEALYDYSKLVEPSATDLERIARAESEKRDAEKREKKFRDLCSKYSKKFPSKTDLASVFPAELTLDSLVTQPEACALFYVHLEQICENSSLDYYRVWSTEWKGQSIKHVEKLKEIGNRIYDAYLSPASESAISLNNQAARQTVFKAVKGTETITVEMFDLINTEVKDRLKPLLLDFKRSLEVK
jgi:hypothetical protein